jgi:hypothetical protein
MSLWRHNSDAGEREELSPPAVAESTTDAW